MWELLAACQKIIFRVWHRLQKSQYLLFYEDTEKTSAVFQFRCQQMFKKDKHDQTKQRLTVLKLGVINIQCENVHDASVGSTVNRRAHCCLTPATPAALSRSASARCRLRSPEYRNTNKNWSRGLWFLFLKTLQCYSLYCVLSFEALMGHH